MPIPKNNNNKNLLKKRVKKFQYIIHWKNVLFTSPFCTRKEAPNKRQPQILILIYESEENYFLPKSNWLILVIKEKKSAPISHVYETCIQLQ